MKRIILIEIGDISNPKYEGLYSNILEIESEASKDIKEIMDEIFEMVMDEIHDRY